MYHWRDVENLDAVDWWKHASMRGFVLVKDEQHPVMQAATNLRHEMHRRASVARAERCGVVSGAQRRYACRQGTKCGKLAAVGFPTRRSYLPPRRDLATCRLDIWHGARLAAASLSLYMGDSLVQTYITKDYKLTTRSPIWTMAEAMLTQQFIKERKRKQDLEERQDVEQPQTTSPHITDEEYDPSQDQGKDHQSASEEEYIPTPKDELPPKRKRIQSSVVYTLLQVFQCLPLLRVNHYPEIYRRFSQTQKLGKMPEAM
ncbi:hypothetical protein J6590_070270 [Homalodisca vitripennis]|nr:hypothetical protein J6590_070270 [Homalodisca vitripennis]